MVSEQVDNFQILAALISSRTGLRLRDEDRDNWHKVIRSRLKNLKLPAFEEYRQFLISDSHDSKAEWKELAGSLTTGETYFFRDKGQFALIRNWILPELIDRRQDKKQLRIWSAGCSTGEEPYSIAIILNELLQPPLIPPLPKGGEGGWDILIIGTDINERAIEKAKRGVYGQWSFRMCGSDFRDKYFNKRKDGWELDARIKEMVRFKTGNLVEDLFPDYASGIYDMDIILCRNVFIYFNDEAGAITLKKLTGTLAESGYLITGHGELYGRRLERIQSVMFPESVVYQKNSEFGIRTAELKKEKKEILEIPKPKIKKEEPVIFLPSEISIPQSEFKTLLDTAESYADAGEYDKAASACRKAIELDSTAVKPYFLLAHIVEANGNIEEAKVLLKKAIYLEPDFISAYLELGAIYDNEGDSERAEKMRSVALELLKALPSDAAVEPYKGITAGELAGYVEKLLDFCHSPI